MPNRQMTGSEVAAEMVRAARRQSNVEIDRRRQTTKRRQAQTDKHLNGRTAP